MIILLILAVLLCLYFGIVYVVYAMAFKSDKKREAKETDMPNEEKYQEYAKRMEENVAFIHSHPCEEVSITSCDGLKLYGRYFHRKDGAPLLIFFHGYRGNSNRDGNGGFRISYDGGYNLLMVDQRAHGKSEGKTITFGIKERYDCRDWISYAIEKFGNEIQIAIIGVSMGAATVMMASGMNLPENVKGMIADCGYSTPKDIISRVIEQMKLPVRFAYPLVKDAAKIYGGFELDEETSLKAMSQTKIPVLLIHGACDGLVPCEMSREVYQVHTGRKELVIVDNADHGMSYYVDMEKYVKATNAFLKQVFLIL